MGGATVGWDFAQWMGLVSAIVYLGLATLAVVQRKRDPMTPPFARMTAALFAYETFELLKHVTGEATFLHLECAAASLVAPTTAAVVITFLGQWRALRGLVIAGASYFSLLALLCIGAIFVEPLRAFSADAPWATAMLAGMVPEFGYLGIRLARHAASVDPTERARTQLLVLALVLGAGGASSDLSSIAGLPAPRVAVFGLLVAAFVLAALAFRMEIVAVARTLVIANVILVVLVAVLLHVIALTWSETPALTATLAVAITIAALATLRPIVAVQAEDRARQRKLATLGRFSAQMAHDLKNPLAAIRGAAQFLIEERRRGGSIDAHESFVELILEQTDRATRVVDDYQRLGRTEAVKRPLDAKALVEELAHAQRAASERHPIETRADGALADVPLDRDLVLGALENLVRNAREAMPDGGAIEIGAARDGDTVRLWVEDRGPGMDPRQAERAFDEFHTTKTTGSSLGLAFVSRMTKAHNGRARLRTALGQGTRVTMELPC
jgi:signal transduction histidine kinase